jgi:hypothetical protein
VLGISVIRCLVFDPFGTAYPILHPTYVNFQSKVQRTGGKDTGAVRYSEYACDAIIDNLDAASIVSFGELGHTPCNYS